jgi:hypothetical protein
MDQRKEAIRNYKERKIPRGIFVVRCNSTARRWVGSSPNLDAAHNALWFQLRLGGHRSPDMQAEWNAQGEAAFAFEILETLDPGLADMAVRDELKSRRKAWAAQLEAPLVST